MKKSVSIKEKKEEENEENKKVSVEEKNGLLWIEDSNHSNQWFLNEKSIKSYLLQNNLSTK